MTADNLPLLGTVDDVAGAYGWPRRCGSPPPPAQHAASRSSYGQQPTIDGHDALRPGRFTGQHPDHLSRRALRLYRDI